MNVKRSVVALATTGGAAALVFGGSAVATDFTTAHSGSVKARTATVADSVQGFDIALDNAIPGESVTQKASYKNDGSRGMALVLTLKAPQTEGANAGALRQKATIAIQGVGTIPLSAIPASGSYSFGTVAAGGSLERTVTLALPQSAGNEVSDASVTVPFTLTATATK